MGKTHDLTPVPFADADKLERQLAQVSRDRPQVIESDVEIVDDAGDSLISNNRHAVGSLSQTMRHGSVLVL